MFTPRKSWNLGVGLVGVLGVSACADPCLDDGLGQDQEGDCPALASASDSDTDSATDTDTATATDGDGTCGNGVQDGDETDVDCGGSCADNCGDGQGCGDGDDCISGTCGDDNNCEPTPTCGDGVQNGDETDIDCGGSCPADCDDGQGCAVNEDCVSMSCDPATMTCVPGGNCTDGAQNGDETDIDCGGSCETDCDNGEGCLVNEDCISVSCDPDRMVCIPGTSCRDGLQNGDESDVDCGGLVCDPCDDGETCDDDGDCASGICDEDAGVCIPPACDDGVQNGDETDVDCGGSCPDDCDDGEGCLVGDDCISDVCDPILQTCDAPTCDDGVQNGTETDLDCGGMCLNTCETGEGCLSGLDCVNDVCDPDDNTCAPELTVVAAPACSDFEGQPILLNSVASGGTGNYTYSWTPIAGLDDASAQNPNASPSGFVTYTVTVDDGVNQAFDTLTVVDAQAFDLQNNCTLYQGDFPTVNVPASITYSQGGTLACETGNNDFGLHLCEGVVFQDVRLEGVLEVTNDGNDDDMIGLVWGAQNNSNFYSLSWKRAQQNFFGCAVPPGIVVKRVEAPDFASLTGADMYCPADSANSTLLLAPADTTVAGWEEGESYTVTIDYTTMGSSVTVLRDSDSFQVAQFDVVDATFGDGFFGSSSFSQINACIGPLNATCL